MSYDKVEVFERAKKIILNDKSIVFIDDLVCELGISLTTFYAYYPSQSAEMKDIKDLLFQNKAKVKKKLRTQWEDVDSSASLQISLYKLLANDKELERLNPPKQKEEETKKVKPIVEWTEENIQTEDKIVNE